MDVVLPIFYDTFRGRETLFFPFKLNWVVRRYVVENPISLFGSSTGVKPPLLWQADSLRFFLQENESIWQYRGCCPFGGVFNITKSDGYPPVFEVFLSLHPDCLRNKKNNDHFDVALFFPNLGGSKIHYNYLNS